MMVNRSKQKGTAAETAVVNWLHRLGFGQAERLALRGNLDVGDVRVRPGIHLEVKAGAAAAHPSQGQVVKWRDEATVEGVNGGVDCYLVTKRKGSADPGTWLVHLTLRELSELLTTSQGYARTWIEEPAVITLSSLVMLTTAQLHRPIHPSRVAGKNKKDGASSE